MAIFTHTDSDGGFMEILAEFGDPQEDLVVLFNSPRTPYQGSQEVRLGHAAEARLYAALTERIGDRVGPGPDPIYTALVRRLVAEEVARVLPLHQAPQAAVPEPLELCDCAKFRANPHLAHDPEPAYRVDPEPQAVGHPEAPAVDWSDKLWGAPDYPPGLSFDYCTSCGHGWGMHHVRDGCVAHLGKDSCGCTRKRGAE